MIDHPTDLVDAVARCLLKEEDKTAGVADWSGELGAEYRRRASAVLRTIDRYQAGFRSGGLSPVLEFTRDEPTLIPSCWAIPAAADILGTDTDTVHLLEHLGLLDPYSTKSVLRMAAAFRTARASQPARA